MSLSRATCHVNIAIDDGAFRAATPPIRHAASGAAADAFFFFRRLLPRHATLLSARCYAYAADAADGAATPAAYATCCHDAFCRRLR